MWIKLSQYILKWNWNLDDCKAGADTSALTEGTKDSLDRVVVYDLNGNEIPIFDLWKDRKAVVAFARHFGWLFEALCSNSLFHNI